jgi:hypothetical protein
VRKILREYRAEIAIVLLILMGIFLLVERMELQSMITKGFLVLQSSLKNLLALIKIGVQFYIFSLSLSDLIGWILLILGIAIAIWMVRYRFTHSPTLLASGCPKCGSELHRVHRKYFDRFLSRTLLPHARRYRCANPDCRWTGLRHPRHRHQPPQIPSEFSGFSS